MVGRSRDAPTRGPRLVPRARQGALHELALRLLHEKVAGVHRGPGSFLFTIPQEQAQSSDCEPRAQVTEASRKTRQGNCWDWRMESKGIL